MKSLIPLVLVALIPCMAQQPKFELADVHVSKTPRWFAEFYLQPISQIRDGRYIFRDASVLSLIREAYGVSEDMIAGGPSWLRLDIYDVVAKIPEGATPAATKEMLQGLLAERFGLTVRRESHSLPRYVLGVSISGLKMTPAAKSETSGCQRQGPGPTPGAVPNIKVACRNLTSQQIVDNLRQLAGGPINTYLPKETIDATGLEGKWDFTLEFTPIGYAGDKGSDAITLFDAVNKQLGLTLELKDVPVPALVIANVNRNPKPNPPSAANSLALAAARFEVASIKPVQPGAPPPANRAGSEMRFVGTLRSLITQAFMITPNSASDVIIGLPKSADSQVWDISAKLPTTGEGASMGQAVPRSVTMEMLRGLLADQFELKTHTENRQVTVYAMTVKGKHKMERADGTERSQCPADPAAVKPVPNIGTMVSCRNISMEEFAANLNQASGFFDHPIVNETGLTGGWNFKLGFPRSTPMQPTGAAATGTLEPASITSYEAVDLMMGVKLVKKKKAIPVIVVNHVAEKPLE